MEKNLNSVATKCANSTKHQPKGHSKVSKVAAKWPIFKCWHVFDPFKKEKVMVFVIRKMPNEKLFPLFIC
ncbi:MAG: hypothetical protein H0W50_08120 [Parachlamydiaceae bacterium]|nr:hypothetical protein [Parachlamydiaceae bacterium]